MSDHPKMSIHPKMSVHERRYFVNYLIVVKNHSKKKSSNGKNTIFLRKDAHGRSFMIDGHGRSFLDGRSWTLIDAHGRSLTLMDAHYWMDTHGRSDAHDAGRTLAGRVLVGRIWTILDVRKILSCDGHGHASKT
jgi:hypothetical protein